MSLIDIETVKKQVAFIIRTEQAASLEYTAMFR